MNAWHAVFAALLMLAAKAGAAEDLNGAARELALKTVAFAGSGATVTVGYRDLSSLGPAALGQARAAFEAALRQAGARAADGGAVEAQLTISENASRYLLVEEIRKGDQRMVWLASWKRGEADAGQPQASLEQKLVWQQEEQILDVAFPPAGMLVLARSGLLLYARRNEQWEPAANVPIKPVRPFPRDLRGHLNSNAASFRAFLPGALCTGSTEPTLTAECHPSEEPWTIESGSRALLLANFAPGRNYFDGRIITQSGVAKTVTPFYAAASATDRGQPLWLMTQVDGRAQIFDNDFNPAATVSGWGSDVAGVDARCTGSGSAWLAVGAGDSNEPDVIRAYSVQSRQPVPLGAPANFPGPVTALWPAGGSSALAVARDLSTGRYLAYVLTVACGS